MIKCQKTIKIGILIIGLCLLTTLTLYKKDAYYEKEQTKQVAISFLKSLTKYDQESAIKYVLSNTQLDKDLKNPDKFLSFKDSKILGVIRVNEDSTEGRSKFYQAFYKIISVVVKIKVVHTDDIGNPAGDYILFITLVKKSPQSEWLITELGSGP